MNCLFRGAIHPSQRAARIHLTNNSAYMRIHAYTHENKNNRSVLEKHYGFFHHQNEPSFAATNHGLRIRIPLLDVFREISSKGDIFCVPLLPLSKTEFLCAEANIKAVSFLKRFFLFSFLHYTILFYAL